MQAESKTDVRASAIMFSGVSSKQSALRRRQQTSSVLNTSNKLSSSDEMIPLVVDFVALKASSIQKTTHASRLA